MSNFEVGDRVVVVGVTDTKTELLYKRGEVKAVLSEAAYEFNIELDLDGWDGALFKAEELELEGVYDALSAKPAEEVFSSDPEVDSRLVEEFLEIMSSPRDDVINHPSHYTSHPSGVECKDIIGHYPFFVGSAMKYLWRAGLKAEDPIEDLRKAIKNIEFEIERLGGSVG